MHKSVSDNQHIDKLLLCLEWPEIVAPVGGGVRLACSLHFRREYLGLDEAFLFPLLTGEGQGEVSSRVEKFKSLEEVKTNPSLFTPHSSLTQERGADG